MKTTTLLLLSCLSLFGQPTTGLTVSVIKTLSTAATLTYTAPTTAACTVQISESPGFSPLSYDVDPTLFPGSNLDSRGGTSMGSGTLNRIFLAGKQETDQGSDGNWYSRALQTVTTHYYWVVCGSVGGQGSFATANIPAGNLHNDLPIPGGAATSFLWKVPTFSGVRGQKINDPWTGALLVRQTLLSDGGSGGAGVAQGNGGLTRPHTNTLFTSGDGKQGYVSCYWNNTDGGAMYFFIPSTGEVRFIGSTGPIINPVMRDDKTFLLYMTTPTVPTNGLYNVPYTGTFMPGDFALGTPVLNVADSSGGVCGALNIYDSTRFPNPGSVYQCNAFPTYANQYTTFFLPAIGLPSQDSQGVQGVMWGGDGRNYDPTCSAGPSLCPHLVAAYIVGDPVAKTGCNKHNGDLWTDDLVQLNLKSEDGSCPGGFASIIFWHFLTDPNGTSLGSGLNWGYGGHDDIKGPNPYVSNGTGIGPTASIEEASSFCAVGANGCAYDTVAGFPQSTYLNVTQPSVAVGGYNNFANVGYGGWGLVRHPNWEQDAVQTTTNRSVNDANTFFDSIVFGGAGYNGSPGSDILNSSVALVPGKTMTYEAVLQSYSLLGRKQQDTMAKNQAAMLIDVSGTGTNHLCDTSTCQGTYCVPNVSGECFSGDVVGHVYFNPATSGLAALGCFGSEQPNTSVADICIMNNTTQMMVMAQLWGTGPGDGYLKSRMLTHGLAPGSSFENSGSTFKPYPDTSWVTFQTGLWISAYPGDVWALKLPPYPTSDGIDRSTFVRAPVSITTPSGFGIATATIEFWYDRYGTGNCTSRNEACVVTASTVVDATPFWFKTTEAGSYTRAACASSCTITIPVLPINTAHWVAKGYDASGAYVMDIASGVAMEGTVISLGVSSNPVVLSGAPVGLGPSLAGGKGPGFVKYFDWYHGTASGCTPGPIGICVGPPGIGDTMYWTAWLPSASGLPVPTGLPIVGTLNDNSFGSGPPICSNNISVLQLDTFDWTNPNAAHMSKVNCMSDFGPGAGTNSPPGWFLMTYGGDTSSVDGTWKSHEPFSRSGWLVLPVERQISAGTPSIHDATIIVSPDSGAHWCNPYTYFNHSGSPGCDSTNWGANGDAPHCDAPSNGTPCTATSYKDATHSSIMWKQLPVGTENWMWVGFGNQDGQPFPAGNADGCNPATWVCYMLQDGTLGRHPAAGFPTSLLDISQWQYYTCPTITAGYRCPSALSSSWTTNFASRTSVVYLSGYETVYGATSPQAYNVAYIKEFGSYLISSVTQGQSSLEPATSTLLWAPAIEGPYTLFTSIPSGITGGTAGFVALAPALGYNVISTNPPHVQFGMTWDAYPGLGVGDSLGAAYFAQLDLVLGRNSNLGANFRNDTLLSYTSGAGYQFSTSNLTGTFPASGLVWSFDFLDRGAGSFVSDCATNGIHCWPYFIDRGTNSAIMASCFGGSFAAPSGCGYWNAGQGTTMNDVSGIVLDNGGNYGGSMRAFLTPGIPAPTGAPSVTATPPMAGNASYSVVGVYKQNSVTGFSREGGIWTTGQPSSGDNTMVSMDQQNGTVRLNWNAPSLPHYQFISSFTFPQSGFTNWYFLAVTVKAGTSCTTNCVPTAHMWVGQSGALSDALAGVSYTNSAHAASTQTPNVSAGPFVLGINADNSAGWQTGMSYATMMVYNRALTQSEVFTMYNTMRAKMAQRGITLQ